MHGTLPNLPAKPPAALRASARRRVAAPRPVTHIALPGYEVGRAEPRRRETITALLKRTGWARRDAQYGWQFRNGLPTILTVNGEPLLRKRWRHTRIGADDVVQFVSRPLGGQQGGTGKQVIGLVALIAVVAFAAWAPAALFSLAGWQATAATALIGLGGSLLINSLTAPKAGATNDPNAKTDQIYTASATGNLPKLGQPLPVGYGREKVYPDFAATPWGEFVANDQYQNILLSVGLGKYDYEQLYIDDTPFWNPADGVAPAFSSAQIEFYDPGEQVTLFPASVNSSSEVTGQQLPHGTGVTGYNPTTPGAWIGGYAANPAGTVAQAIAVDFVFPAGCFVVPYGQKTDQPLAVDLRVEYRLINDAGAAVGDWNALFAGTRTYNSRSPIRDSIKFDVAPGRYEVRFRRNDDVPPSDKGASDIVWAGLRTFLQGNNTFPVSTIAIRIKGTESTQGSFKFGAVRTRILPVWNGSTFVEQPTRNNAWAFFDAVTNEQYGSGHPISKVDFNAIVAHAAGCDARGDHFDYTFGSAAAVPDTFDKILMPSRARHFWLGDVISLVRDEWRDVPSMLLTDREIVRDSTQISWTMLGEEDPDAVILEYIDEETWRPAQVQYPPEVTGFGGFHALNAETKRIDGILNRDHAYRECAFLYLQSIYRRENVSIATEYEGRAITFGSVLRVQSELPMAYGYGGAVADRSGDSLTLSPAPGWADAGNHYIRLRRPNGKWFGPVLVTRGASDAIAVLDSGQLATAVSTQGISLSDVLAREDGGEDPSFDFGTADNQSRLCVVLSGQPNGNQCTLNLVVDDVRVHATDLGNPPVLPTGQFPADLNAPLIVGLNATFGQGVAEPKLSASWFPAAGAFYYVAEVSYDSGTNWIQVYEGRDNKFDAVVALAALTLRVQAVGKLHGPYSEISLGAPTIVLGDSLVALQSLTEAIREQVTTAFTATQERIADAESIIDLLANEVARNRLDKTGLRGQVWDIRKDVIDQIEVGLDAANASIESVQTVAVTTQSALASYQVTTTATLGSIQSQVTTNSTAYSTLNAAFSSYQTTVTAQFGAVNSSINNESVARATADTAIAATVTSLTSTVNSNSAAITAEQVTRANADSALSASISTVSTTVGGHTASLQLVASSVNGSSVMLGLIGTIDGVTGGLVLSGVGQNGVVSYNLYLRGDFIVDGTITGAKIQAGSISASRITAGSISTTQIAVGGVDLVNLIDGAASSMASNSGTAGSGEICNTVINVKGGRLIVWANFISAGAANNIDGTIHLDGVQQRIASSFSPNGATVPPSPIQLQLALTGVSDGNHTVSIRTVSGNSVNGSVIAFNPRK